MRIAHRNTTVELPDDDPRVAVIELLLFGQAKALPVFAPPAPAEPPPPPPPAVPLPKGVRDFWKALPDPCRVELRLLATAPRQVDDLCRVLRIRPGELQGVHFSTNRLARLHRVTLTLLRAGHDRRYRRFWVPEEQAVWLRTLVAEEQVAVRM